MPPRVDYVPRPFVRDRYEPDTRTMLQLMQMAARARAEGIRAKGQNSAQGLYNLGQFLSGSLGNWRQEREQQAMQQAAAQRQAQEDAFKRRDQQLREADLLTRVEEREQARQDRLAADQYKRGTDVAEEVQFGPMSEPQMESVLQGPAAGRARYVFGPGTADGPELQPTQQQQRGIQVEQSINAMGGQIGPNGQVVMPPKPEREPNPTEASLAMLAARGDRMAAQALQTLQRMRQSNQGVRQPIWVVGPDGQFQDLAGVAPPGSKPASSREQGRAVTSGDANRIADLTTSLDDVSVLGKAISGLGATGTSAAVGAAVPNWVTEFTGWGEDAKKKQALIDRVKQVIGKALEEGVLRKEDEKKYEKILPTIKDPNAVVLSKLKDLGSAITLRRQRQLEALADAGYDVSRFLQREPPKTESDDAVDALIKKYGGDQ